MRRSLLALAVTLSAAPSCLGQRLLGQGTRISAGGTIYALKEYDGKLVIAGRYASFNEHARPNLQGWDGTNHFDMPGAFVGSDDEVRVILVFNGDLVVAGKDADIGNISRWDGSSWQPMGAGIPGTAGVMELVEFNGELLAGAGYGQVHRWNGNSWELFGQALATSQNIPVAAMAVHQGQLYAACLHGEQLMHWSGTVWETAGPVLNDIIKDLKSTAEGLLIAGNFSSDVSEVLAIPGYALYDGSTFSAPFGDLGLYNVNALIDGPDGSLIFGCSTYESLLWNGSVTAPILMSWVWSAAPYQGEFFIGGWGWSTEGDSTALARLEEGMELTYLDANDVRVEVMPTSIMYTRRRFTTQRPFEVPVGSGRSSMLLWVPLFSTEAEMDTFLQAPLEPDHASSTGPHADATGLDYHRRYHQLWRIDRDEITHHIAHHADPGYYMPYNIASWPGNGDAANGEPARVAPFIDLNGNGIYEPAAGEYPAIRGDLAIYYIQHDYHDSLWFPERALLDRHVMHYAFRNSWDGFLHQTVFTNIKLINRSDRTYTNAYFGAQTFFEIGCPDDDLIACDTTLSLSYMYNGDNNDDGCLDYPAYGQAPPAQGVVWLSSPMTSSVYYNRPGGTQEYIEAEAIHFALNGLDGNGTPLTDPAGDTTTFLYYGDPNDPLQWNETNTTPATPDRVLLSATGPFTIGPSDTVCVDMAFVFARDSIGGHLASVTLLKQRAAELHAWYAQQNIQCNGSHGIATTMHERDDRPALNVQPNPAQDEVVLTGLGDGTGKLLLIDAQGRSLRNERITFAENWRLDTSRLPDGMYTILLRTNGDALSARLVIAR